MTANPTAETITISNVAANAVFDDDIAWDQPEKELVQIPGFKNPDSYRDIRESSGYHVPAIFMITRMSDGKVFGAEFGDSTDANFPIESPFHPVDGETVFREVQKKTRVITEEYVKFA